MHESLLKCFTFFVLLLLVEILEISFISECIFGGLEGLLIKKWELVRVKSPLQKKPVLMTMMMRTLTLIPRKNWLKIASTKGTV